MANSYPTRDQARGIWKINDITKNINTKGTWPGSFGDTAIFMGGNSDVAASMQEIDTVQISTAGNSTDFGDLTAAKFDCGAIGGNFRGICTGGRTPSILNVIEYVHFASLGNGADFGDLTSARLDVKSINNLTRGVTGSGATPSNSNVMDFITIQTLGNAVDFGDLTVARSRTGATQSPTRGVWGGGFVDGSPAVKSNVLDFIEISSTGNATDFGDLATATAYPSAYSSQVSGMWGGGSTPSNTTKIEKINFGSLGNATDFGNLRTARGGPAGSTANSTKGIYAGGENPSGTTWLNEIETESLTSSGTGVDFGDLSRAKSALAATSQAHGGLVENFPRAPELYSPTGTVVPNGFGQGDIGVYNGGEAPGSTNVIEFIQISTIGNSQDFGDLTSANAIGGAVSNSTRYVTIGDNTDTLDTHYLEFRTKGNTAFFGDLTVRGWAGAGGSNSTRGINYGRANPATSGTANETIDYITTATIGNWTDFGNCNVASYFNGGTNSSTRMVKAGGITEGPNTITDSMEYITIGSTGNGTDFGDLVASNGGFSCGNVSNGTRGIFGGGSVNPANNTNTNVIQYITIASTSNTTDFGDLTVARRYSGSSCNSTRGVWAGGENPSNSNTMDYVTIASTGNAIDYGDLAINVSRHGGASNGHGGLS